MSYFDAGAVLIIIVILIWAHSALSVHPLKFLQKLITEFKQLAQSGLTTTGAVDALAIIVVALFGALIFIENVLHFLLSLAVSLLHPQQVHEYVESVTALTLLIVVAAIAALSVLLT
jgi:hypothetical protein